MRKTRHELPRLRHAMVPLQPLISTICTYLSSSIVDVPDVATLSFEIRSSEPPLRLRDHCQLCSDAIHVHLTAFIVNRTKRQASEFRIRNRAFQTLSHAFRHGKSTSALSRESSSRRVTLTADDADDLATKVVALGLKSPANDPSASSRVDENSCGTVVFHSKTQQ